MEIAVSIMIGNVAVVLQMLGDYAVAAKLQEEVGLRSLSVCLCLSRSLVSVSATDMLCTCGGCFVCALCVLCVVLLVSVCPNHGSLPLLLLQQHLFLLPLVLVVGCPLLKLWTNDVWVDDMNEWMDG